MPNFAVSRLDEDAIIVASKDQVASELGDEKVILSLEEGMYYGLNPVGARIWELIQEPTTIRDVRDQLLEEYDVDAEQCERDIRALASDLAAEELIEVREQ